MIGLMEGETGKFVQSARLDDDNDDDIFAVSIRWYF